MKNAIVTRDSLQAMLDKEDPEFVARVVGRALVAIFDNQTREEKSANVAAQDNGIGFSGADARTGCLGAKSFIKNKTLLDWQVAQWTKRGKNGYSRLTKYTKQLNTIALRKQGA